MKICIIGAGSSGIVAAKTLKQYQIPFDCYEAGSKIGGNWRYNNDNAMSSAYRSLHINTSRKMMEYSDFPMPKHYPHFPHHSQIIDYFDDYVAHFNIKENIIFNTKIIDVTFAKNKKTYLVTTDKNETKEYDGIIVANGHHWNPRLPEPMFEGNFEGETLHSHYYRTPEIFENKNVLIVGIGNSAVDIACEAARLHTGKVFISTRSGAYILPNYILGKPFDELSKNIPTTLPLWTKRLLLNAALWIARGKQADYGVPKPTRPILSEHPTNSQDLLNLTGRGKVVIKPNIQQLAGKNIVFEDNTQEKIDIILWCTGYKMTFPFFKNDFFPAQEVENSNDLQLYKRVIHPDYKNLFFLGLIQPLGAIMPLAELQAQWIAQLLTKKMALPSEEFMWLDIEKTKEELKKRYKESKRHTIQVDFFDYKKVLEKEMRQMKTHY
ncbi:MAG: NAD(P)/FAD-dependent oxidoreductase [Cytophagia bacterium]|nr:MAG: NAD(P)/FAD-dependent oxidoreductase [Cytophagales bacterium]TAG02454.1 MAG: NAD(P)/FAD-dependent oxidoreductase [Cytophagia bacterium]TAG41791.1 MAG: NAD(P)/FAD-dependent oxidoreductase [Cytophagia bacterium]